MAPVRSGMKALGPTWAAAALAACLACCTNAQAGGPSPQAVVDAAAVPPPASASAIAPAVQTASSPEAAVRHFYAWYLGRMVANQNPLQDERPALRHWVSDELLGEIQRRMDSPDGLDADYFLQAQDYDDAWLAQVAELKARSQGTQARVDLTLGPRSAQPWRLTVTLVQGRDGWKIRRVRKRA